MVCEPFHVPMRVGGDGDSADWAIAAHGERDELVFPLQHGPHHLRAHHQATERRRYYRARVVAIARGLYGIARANRKGANHAIGCDSAYQMVAGFHPMTFEIDDAFGQSGPLFAPRCMRVVHYTGAWCRRSGLRAEKTGRGGSTPPGSGKIRELD